VFVFAAAYAYRVDKKKHAFTKAQLKNKKNEIKKILEDMEEINLVFYSFNF
jgi:hypothetical protein